ncbi:MAG: S8 family serine peptidase [Halobacteriovoraceae bacterium]|jgi:thermitase|nr:S8 family serine peptidase [Halobacteriovoraceae bacterium]
MRLFISLGMVAFIVASTLNYLPKKNENYIIKVSNNLSQGELIDKYRIKILDTLHKETRVYLVESSREMKSDKNILWVSKNKKLQGTALKGDPDFSRVWGYKNTGAPLERSETKGIPGLDIDLERAWETTEGSSDVIVAILDSGVDFSNHDLIKNRWQNDAEIYGVTGEDDDGNGLDDDYYGWDFENDDNDPQDDNLHGSHIAGIIGAQADNQLGIAGINKHVKMMHVKWLDASLFGDTSKAVKAMHYAIDKGAKIISCSWGDEDEDDEDYQAPQALIDVVERARKEKILIVAAAGNNGYNLSHGPVYPASLSNSFENVISVGAVDNRGELWSAHGFGSNFGKESVDIAAPGEDIVSYVLDSKVKPLSGTSMATPFVAGVAALVLAANPDFSASDLKQRLVESAVTTPYLREKFKSGGMLNAYYAVTGKIPPTDPNDPYNFEHVAYQLEANSRDEDLNDKEYIIKAASNVKQFVIHFKAIRAVSGNKIEIYDEADNLVQTMSASKTNFYSKMIYGNTVKIKVIQPLSNWNVMFKVDSLAIK